MPLDHWVSDNNPAMHLQYGKGWWDYIEILRRVVEKFDVEHVDVVGTYVMKTPPPPEDLLMPVVRLRMGAVVLIVKYDFGTFPDTWTVSARIPNRSIASTFGLFDRDQRLDTVAGFDASWVYPPYSVSPERFSCELRDEWDLAAFVRLVTGAVHA